MVARLYETEIWIDVALRHDFFRLFLITSIAMITESGQTRRARTADPWAEIFFQGNIR